MRIVPLGQVAQTATGLELRKGEVVAHLGGLQVAALLPQEAVAQGLGLPVRAELGLHLDAMQEQILGELTHGLHTAIQAGENLALQGLAQMLRPFLQGGGRRGLSLDVRDRAQPQLLFQLPREVLGREPLTPAVHALALEIPRCDGDVDVGLTVPGIRVDPSMIGAPHIAEVLQGNFDAPEHLRSGQTLAGCRPQDDVRDLVLQRRTIVQPAELPSDFFRDLPRHVAVQCNRAISADVIHAINRARAVDDLANHASPRMRSRRTPMSSRMASSRSSRRRNSSFVWAHAASFPS